MAALVHDRHGSDRSWSEPSEDRGAVRLGETRGRSGSAGSGREERRRPVFAIVVVVGLMLAGGPVVDAVASLTGGSSPTSSAPARDSSVIEGRTHVVQPGETYWSLAEDLGGEGDVRARVDALEAANNGKSLHAGDRLAVPVLD